MHAYVSFNMYLYIYSVVLTLLLVAYFEAWVPSVFRDRDDEAAASQSATLAENARANNEESETILV